MLDTKFWYQFRIYLNSRSLNKDELLQMEVQKFVREAAEIVILVIDEEDVESLISELVIAVNDSQVFHVLLLTSSV
ncbi:unnamed protein product [Prunus armeniaca]|uniref:Uncharacterized protein n=1 Tax=Prunus armeniaca TaxID=36596 RepID=A0A6J5TW46_PRUAR|nr:unnamed protein product [Prunus armeniaca]